MFGDSDLLREKIPSLAVSILNHLQANVYFKLWKYYLKVVIEEIDDNEIWYTIKIFYVPLIKNVTTGTKVFS